jgi:hypothetical protein
VLGDGAAKLAAGLVEWEQQLSVQGTREEAMATRFRQSPRHPCQRAHDPRSQVNPKTLTRGFPFLHLHALELDTPPRSMLELVCTFLELLYEGFLNC